MTFDETNCGSDFVTEEYPDVSSRIPRGQNVATTTKLAKASLEVFAKTGTFQTVNHCLTSGLVLFISKTSQRLFDLMKMFKLSNFFDKVVTN